jgi:hypothetical protein
MSSISNDGAIELILLLNDKDKTKLIIGKLNNKAFW